MSQEEPADLHPCIRSASVTGKKKGGGAWGRVGGSGGGGGAVDYRLSEMFVSSKTGNTQLLTLCFFYSSLFNPIFVFQNLFLQTASAYKRLQTHFRHSVLVSCSGAVNTTSSDQQLWDRKRGFISLSGCRSFQQQ